MSTVAQRVQLGPFFSAGILQGAAKLYHYGAGTSTLKDIWLDRAMGTTLAQPFVADANGVFNFFADGIYKLIICGPNSTGPSVDVLYTLDNWSFLDPTDPTFDEGDPIASASAISVGPEVWAHITGSTNIDTIGGTIPFFWAVFDGNLTLNYSASLLTPASINLAVRQGDVVFFVNEGSNVWRVAAHYQADGLLVATQDSRTNTVDVALTVRSTTSGTPAAGIGTGIGLEAKVAAGTTTEAVRLNAVFSDVGASFASFFQVMLRTAGQAIGIAYEFYRTTQFTALFTHANTANRVYTLPDRALTIGAGDCYIGPSSIGAGSTRSIETFVSATGNLGGVHYYSGDVTLNSGHTLTVPAGSGRLVIIATGTITINGTITATGGGLLAGGVSGGAAGNNGTDQPGGSAPSFAGGAVVWHGLTVQAGPAAAAAATQVSGSSVPGLPNLLGSYGGASGAGGVNGSGTGGAGGRGGATVILIAPAIVLAATAVITTSGAAGGNGTPATTAEGGGGGGAGNFYVMTRSFTDNGATITLTGGAGGTGNGGASNGLAGATGVKQILSYT